jgi:hypothetical protein
MCCGDECFREVVTHPTGHAGSCQLLIAPEQQMSLLFVIVDKAAPALPRTFLQ